MKYNVSDLSKILGVTTNTIRRYEKEGFITPERDKSDYRWYEEFDICKTAIIRLLIKCGFTHTEIKNMLDNKPDKISEIYNSRLKEIDREMSRLYFLRHWLKDNIQLFDTLEQIGSGFMTMKCPALKYILYSKGGQLLNEKERLETINHFMYTIPEVQLIRIFKLEDVKNHIFIPYDGWEMKEIDIKRLNVEEIVNNNKFVETYPIQQCLYGVLEMPASYINDKEKLLKKRKEFFENAHKYMNENNMKIYGDVMEIPVNVLGDTSLSLICIPYV